MDRLSFNGKDFEVYTKSVVLKLKDVEVIGAFSIDSESLHLLRLALSEKPSHVARISCYDSFNYKTYYYNESVEPSLLKEIECLKEERDLLLKEKESLKSELALLKEAVEWHNESPWYARWEKITHNA